MSTISSWCGAHDNAAAWHGLDETVLFQHRDRFADRGPADAEALRQARSSSMTGSGVA